VKNYDRVLVVAYVFMQGRCPHDKYPDVVGKVYNLCRVKFYSNSRVLGHGRLNWPLLNPMSSFGFGKTTIYQVEFIIGAEYLEGTAVARENGRSTGSVLPRC
jgi:hypothetical protein